MAATRIAENASIHQLDSVHVVLHGGEPLLLGYDRLRGVLDMLRFLIDPVTRLDLRIHTNGVLLDKRLCALFADYRVKIGVSIDGDRAANDRHRRYLDGRSSHAQVLRALALLRTSEYRHLYAGILCTIDLDNDPIAVYEALLAEDPPRLDLLLPHATWDQPPRRPSGVHAPYAAWLGRIHARWIADGCPVPIRLFDSLRSAWEGRPSWSEAVGVDPVDLLVIETDGGWEQTDSLKTAFDGAAATGMNVFSHSADEAAAHPGVAARQGGVTALCATCRECTLVRACGGGLYAHRHRLANGFDNPSVYCDDLKVLIPQVITIPKTTPARQVPVADHAIRHSVPEEAFDLLAAGPGDATAMTALLDAHWSLARSRVAAVAAGLDGRSGDLSRAAAEGWELLCRLDAERPEVVREILTYPYVQAWAVRCLRTAKGTDLDLDRAHLAGLAAAAAFRAGIETELVVPVREGSIYLPTIGVIAADVGAGRTSALRVSSSALSAGLGMREWQTVRRVAIGGVSVTIEDIDPFRDCQGWPPTGRLSAASWRAWRLAMSAAARQLASELPAYASVIGAGLRAVVPLRQDPATHGRSGTARQAFGAVAIGLPLDVDTLCVLLLHEMQHIKLTALCDMFDLFDRSDGSLLQVPWRTDPRPVEPALHGAYAHLAVAEWWRPRAQVRPDGGASRLFAMYRSWVREGIEALASVRTLTPKGERFINGMRTTVEAWADVR